MTAGGAVSQEDFKILLVDDLVLRRACLARLMEDWARDKGYVLEDYPASLDAIDAGAPDVRLIFLSIGGLPADSVPVIALVEDFGKAFPACPLVVLSDRDETAHVVATLKAGARGFVTTRSDPEIVFRALEFILGGGYFFPPGALLHAAETQAEPAWRAPIAYDAGRSASSNGSPLTLRQSEVLHLLRLGQSNKHIARELRMCESTVKVHVRQIMRKLGASNRTQAALCAVELGIADGASGTLENTSLPA